MSVFSVLGIVFLAVGATLWLSQGIEYGVAFVSMGIAFAAIGFANGAADDDTDGLDDAGSGDD